MDTNYFWLLVIFFCSIAICFCVWQHEKSTREFIKNGYEEYLSPDASAGVKVWKKKS